MDRPRGLGDGGRVPTTTSTSPTTSRPSSPPCVPTCRRRSTSPTSRNASGCGAASTPSAADSPRAGSPRPSWSSTPPDLPGYPGRSGQTLRGCSSTGPTLRGVGRDVTLVLVDAEGSLLGALPPFPVEVPYWQEMADVLDQARERYGLRADVLRLLTNELPTSPGGAVTYLAQTYQAVGLPAQGDRPRGPRLSSGSRTRCGPPTPSPAVPRAALPGRVTAWARRSP